MLIRSQDKTILVNVDNAFNIVIRDINGAAAIYAGSSSSCCNIAEYSTKAKAMKVLDMIQEAYTNEKVAQILSYGLRMVPTEEINEAGKIIKNAIQSSTVFQMPEDSEVEV